jgi:hypothetical protein
MKLLKIVHSRLSIESWKILSLLVLPLTFSYFNVSGQTSQPNPTFDQHPIPPSPEAQAFMKYGTYPVDYSSGVPKIEIPIYQIKSGSLSLPVSLNYHASGIKMNDLASSSGLGWSLNAGGMVSRVINQVEDERMFLSTDHYSSDYITNYQPSPTNGYSLVYSYVHDIAFGNYDGRSDDYYYDVGNGLTGQFVYDINKNINQRSFTNNIITRTAQNTFQITGEDGTHYTFNDVEQVNSPISGTCPSSWKISSIISANYKDTISFEYNYFPGFSYSIESQTFNNNNPDVYNSFPSNQKFEKHYSTMIYSESVLIKRIKFKGGTVTFSYESGRKDVMNNRLSAVIINSLSNSDTEVPIKKYQLIHGYFLSNATNPNTFEAKLRLDEIKLFDQNNSYVNSYHFHYNPGIMPPMINQNNPSGQPGGYGCGGCAIDFWGYYNGHVENTNLIPDLPIQEGGPANRSADINYMKAESLEKIDFPTGGSTTFEFEANNATQIPTVGGLRVKKITSTAGLNSLPIIKQYSYNSNNLLTVNAEQGAFTYHQYIDNHGTIIATYVTDYPAKLIYFSEPITPNGSYNGSPVLYTSVTESMDDGSGQKQQTIYNYEYGNDRSYTIPETSKYGNVAYSDKSWARSNLISTSYYKYKSGNYVLNKSIVNHYDTYKAGTVNTGLNCFIQVLHIADIYIGGTYPQQATALPYPGPFFNGQVPPPQYFDFNFFDVYEEVGIRKLIGTEEINYDDNGNPTTNKITNIAYESTEHLFPTKKIQTNSDGNQWISLYKYPFDFRGQSPYDDMISNDIVSPTIQVLNYKNSTAQFISSQKTNYTNWGNNIIAPSSIDIQKGSGPIERSLSIKYNDQANLAQIQKYTGPYTSYQWGYKQLYPIAEVKNTYNEMGTGVSTSSAEVAYSNEKGENVLVVNTDPQNTTLAVTSTGPVIINMLYNNASLSGGHIDASCILTGPNSYSRNFVLSVNDANHSASLTITGLALGTYNLNSSAGFYTPSIAYTAALNITLPSSGVSPAQFFHENFEDGAGNSTLNDAYTGHYSFTGGYAKLLSELTAGSYILSYRQKTNGIWTLQTSPVTVPGNTYYISINGQQIDDIRFYPASAEMTTYTYDPLIGMTSTTDTKGMTTYYEYDSVQRLMNIRDKDRNIIKHIDYNYQH